TAPPVTSPPPAPDPYIDPDQAAAEFFDAANAARAAAGLPAFVWRSDVASMAVAHSAEMAQHGSIWHVSFVSSANLKGLNASSIGENAGLGGPAGAVLAKPATPAAAANVPAGVVTPVPADAASDTGDAAALGVTTTPGSTSGVSTWWAGVLGVLALMAVAGGQVTLKRRRRRA